VRVFSTRWDELFWLHIQLTPEAIYVRMILHISLLYEVILIMDLVCLFISLPLQPTVVVFSQPVAGFSLLVFEVS
jgi:hypothetical protein